MSEVKVVLKQLILKIPGIKIFLQNFSWTLQIVLIVSKNYTQFLQMTG